MSTPANSKDPAKMQHNAAFHLGLHCIGRKDLQTKVYSIFFKL